MCEGHIIFNGRPGDIKQRISDLGMQMPKYMSPTEFIMKAIDKDEIQIEYELEHEESADDFDIIEDLYQKRIRHIVNFEINARIENLEYKRYCSEISDLNQLKNPDDIHEPNTRFYSNSKTLEKERARRNKPRSMIGQFFLLMLIYSSFFYRKKINYVILLGNMAFVNFFVMVIYRDLGDPERDTFSAIQNRRGFSYLLNLQGSYSGMTYFISNFIMYRKLFYKDKDSRLYSEFPFFLAQITFLIPLFAVLYFGLILVYYWVVGLNSEPQLFLNAIQNYFFLFVGGFVVSINCSALLGALCDRLSTVIALVPMVVIPFSMCTGYFSSLRTATKVIQWFAYLSPMRFGYQGYMLVEFKNARKYVDSCVTWARCPQNPAEKCAVKIPESNRDQCDPMKVTDFIQNDILSNVLYIVLLTAFYGFFAFIALKFKSRKKRMKYQKNPQLRKEIVSNLKKLKSDNTENLFFKKA